MPAASSSSSSSEPPFPCPRGYAWDVERRRFYRLDAKLAKVDSRGPPAASSSSTHAAATLSQPDIPPSSYYFTQAQPPGAFISASSPYLIPRDRPASHASSRRWRDAQVQRHVRSLRCYSRDNVIRVGPDFDDPFDVSRTGLSISSFDRTGSLLMVPSVEQSQGNGDRLSQRKTLCFEQGNRGKGGERWLANLAGTSNACFSFLVDIDRALFPTARQSCQRLASSTHFIAHCEVEGHEVVRRIDGGIRTIRQREAASTGFNKRSLYPRGLTMQRQESCGLESVLVGVPEEHRVVNWQSAVVTEHPRLKETCPADRDALLSFIYHTASDGDDTPHLIGLQIFSAKRVHHLCAPRIRYFERIKKPTVDPRFQVMAINAGSGLCWVGQRDGSIHLVDSMEYCYQQVVQGESSGSFQQIPLHGIPMGAVTNLLPVGKDEVVACFSSGLISLIRAQACDGTHIVREFMGHVNEVGDMNVSACVDSGSRLLAVRGSDGLIRVWHLDHSLPLNGPSYESLNGQSHPLQPSQAQNSRAARLRAESRPGHSAADVSDQKRFDAYDILFYLDFAHPDHKRAMEIPLRDLITRQSVKLHWGYPNWVGTRDAQWEVSREVNAANGLPRVENKGLLPSLMLMENSSDGPRIVWFEVVQSGIV